MTHLAAREVYGVMLSADVDMSATAAHRDAILAKREKESLVRGGSPRAPADADSRADPTSRARVDDNLCLLKIGERGPVSREVVGCVHCGSDLGSTESGLKVAVRNSASSAAGPGVVTDPRLFIDDSVVFREYFCPGCWTRLQCGIVPSDQVDLIGGYRLAE